MPPETKKAALLTILLASCEHALQAFQAADNLVDRGFVVDLERIIERTRAELEALSADRRVRTAGT